MDDDLRKTEEVEVVVGESPEEAMVLLEGGKPFWQSKTIWVNLLVTLSAVLAFVAGPEWPVSLGERELALIISAQGVVNILLRLKTGEPVRFK